MIVAEEEDLMELPVVEPETRIDPVCGMTVALETARERGLVCIHAGTEYAFCGRGCRLEFEEDPEHYLAPGYQPSM